MALYQGENLLSSVVVHETIEGTDTSDATISRGDVVSGKVGYGASGKIYGNLRTDFVWCETGGFTLPSYTIDDSDDKIIASQADFGDATTDQVAEGVTFTSNNGRLLTGTMEQSSSSAIIYGEVTATDNCLNFDFDISGKTIDLALKDVSNFISYNAGGSYSTIISVTINVNAYSSSNCKVFYYDGMDYITQLDSPDTIPSTSATGSSIILLGGLYQGVFPTGATYQYIMY